MGNAIKRIIEKLPAGTRQEIKRLFYAMQMKRGRFVTDEAEYGKLEVWLNDGDWVLDIGANVGHYTCRLARLVGPAGRVIAIEPVEENFELLASNIARTSMRNVTLLNVAASDRFALAGMDVPVMPTGLPNYYMARLSKVVESRNVVCIPIDALGIQPTVRLVKIDVEGHELSVLRGMEMLVERSHPILVVEGSAPKVVSFLAGHGYESERYGDSPNLVYFWEGELALR